MLNLSRGNITCRSTGCSSGVISIFHKHPLETVGNEDASGNEIARKIRIKCNIENLVGDMKSYQYRTFRISANIFAYAAYFTKNIASFFDNDEISLKMSHRALTGEHNWL